MDFNSKITKDKLEKIKLTLEIEVLQKQLKKEPESLLSRITTYVQKNITQILTIVGLFVALFGPVFDYVDDIKKNQLIVVNKAVLPLLDSPNYPIKTSVITEISTLDPKTLAPFLLAELNKGEIDPRAVKAIYVKMFFLSEYASTKTFFDRFLFFFIDDNKIILKKELNRNAVIAFQLPCKKEQSEKVSDIWLAYMDIITELKLKNDEEITEAVTTLKQRIDTDQYVNGLFSDSFEKMLGK